MKTFILQVGRGKSSLHFDTIDFSEGILAEDKIQATIKAQEILSRQTFEHKPLLVRLLDDNAHIIWVHP